MKETTEATGMKRENEIDKRSFIRSLPLLFCSTVRVPFHHTVFHFLLHCCFRFHLSFVLILISPFPSPIFSRLDFAFHLHLCTSSSDRQQMTTDSYGITIWIRMMIMRFISSWSISWCRILIPCPPVCNHHIVHSVRVG